jgi:hypothetical protein
MNRLHITNGDSSVAGIRAVQPAGDLIVWRDVLHEGPVPAGLSLAELSEVRAEFLAGQELGSLDTIRRDFEDRDNCLRRFTDYDEVVLWFEWDLYDQLQLLQILDFVSGHSAVSLKETGTSVCLICIEGYLGTTEVERFARIFDGRSAVTSEMLNLARRAWSAFRSPDPREIEAVRDTDTGSLPFLADALLRHLEDFPSTREGLSRSERQILEAVAQRPLSFSELFRRASAREDRVYCGDAIMAGYIERMSRHEFPLLTHPTGEPIDAPHTAHDSRAFRNSEIALTATGREVLRGDQDWIELGGSDRWLGGVHLEGSRARWRWDPEDRRIVDRGVAG